MTGPVQRKLALFLAMLGMALQVFLPGPMAVAEPDDAGIARFLCVSSGSGAPDVYAAAVHLAELLGEDAPDQSGHDGHCPACTVPFHEPLPEPVILGAPVARFRAGVFVRFEPGLIREAQGPPLGSRGPPVLI
ncbi:hypothetical protein BBF93_06845 [Hyphomonas sp. CACIAM 19H1]|uniref:DUF2946 family protein n=1 Tax=Hyphomonas sp. CACIAM 19H1 TaxID=1873716 RepID=UPI000DEDFFFE|nr:DUF2946 family protein [Hyphomonas sp. CACIAM 19H1]AXE63967.1 hypothetical protein BBF93_06845 [Hyphomonas sp. CACIAM 19H1]